MKPNFALTLSLDGVGLLHRAFPGWHLVGEVNLASADLTVELAELRQKAMALDPSGLRAKLVLPDDQVKYLAIDDVSDDSDIEAAVREALEGATPYAVDDLAYDWSLKDDRLTIAAVARETLAEAEAFAQDHQFNPVCYVATPANGAFTGEPYFGITAWLRQDSGDATEVVRDTVPIRVIGASKLPDTEATETGAAKPNVPAKEVPVPPAPVEPPLAPVEMPQADARAETTSPEVDKDALPDMAEAALDSLEPETDAVPAPDPEPSATSEPAPKPEPKPHTDHAPQDDTPDDTAAFASIRARRDDAAPASPRLDGVKRDATPARITLGPAARQDKPEPGQVPAVSGISDSVQPVEDAATGAAPLQANEDERLATATTLAPEERKPAFFTRRARNKAKAETKAAKIPEPTTEKQRMTIFGARDQTSVKGKPRFLGLILTAVLLLFLICVAAWASIFMDEGLARFFRPEPAPMMADLAPAEGEEAPDAAEDEDDLELATLQPTDQMSVLDDPATEILSRVTPSDLSPDEAKARYAATGIWQLSPKPSDPPQPTELEEFYQTSLDPEPDFQDAVALPAPAEALTDGMMFSPASPPAADTRFVLDSRGFVLATPDGAVSPDGVLVYAGQPSVVPPRTRTKPDPTESTDQPEDVLTATRRPKARPDDFVEKIERDGLSGRTRTELAALRPKLRPESAQEAAEAARKQAETEAAETAAAAANEPNSDPQAINAAVVSAAQATIAFADATPQAVKTSVKPRLKPRNFDKIVRRTKRNQQARQTQEETAAVRTTQKVSPKFPSKASVSKQATERNALKFKRVNLIGVYGTPNRRRALVRMSNGRYKKVKVGDRLDGGKVRAIGDSDLRYQKGGRIVVLKMPRG